MRKLPQSINRPNVNITAPFISLDGNTLLFTSDYSENNEPTIYYSQKDQVNWKEPQVLPRHINNTLNFASDYTLSADGKVIYISSIKSGGIGGYDIYAGTLKGASWGDFQNMFLPINSKLHEGCPTFTSDGSVMYFMRCEKMNRLKAENCKLMSSKKAANGKWTEPVELPPNINTGNSQTPRISADGETLIFASNVLQPNKGGMDLYISKFSNGSWGGPIALDFVNTEKDDQYVSFIANGRYLLKDSPGKFKNEIIEYLVPEELRPRSIMKVEGLVTGENNLPTPAYISVTDLLTHTRVFSGRPDKTGNYFFYITEGSRYELSIDPEEGNYSFFSKTIDMTGANNPLVQKFNATLKPIQADDEFELEGIQFKPYTAELEDANFELRRLSRLVKANPQFNFEFQVLLIGYEEGSTQLTPDLTEISIDSVIIQLEEADSIGQLYSRDSLVIETTYHNNRTEKQALALIDSLVALGVDRNSITYVTNVQPEAMVENRKTRVRMVVRKKP